MARYLGPYLGEPASVAALLPTAKPVPASKPVPVETAEDDEFEVEGCSGCYRLIATTVKCCCCDRPVCRDCAHVSGGVVWCDACLDASWDLFPDEQGSA